MTRRQDLFLHNYCTRSYEFLLEFLAQECEGATGRPVLKHELEPRRDPMQRPAAAKNNTTAPTLCLVTVLVEEWVGQWLVTLGYA